MKETRVFSWLYNQQLFEMHIFHSLYFKIIEQLTQANVKLRSFVSRTTFWFNKQPSEFRLFKLVLFLDERFKTYQSLITHNRYTDFAFRP